MHIDQLTILIPEEGKTGRIFDQVNQKSRGINSYLERYALKKLDKTKQTLRLDSAADQLKKSVSRVSMHLLEAFRIGLLHQIDRLLDVDAWEDGDQPPTEAAFSTFLQMLLILRPPRRPGIAASGDGSITAVWTVGRDRLTIHCFEDGSVRWILSKSVGDLTERAAGQNAVGRIRNVLAPYHPIETWFGNAN